MKIAEVVITKGGLRIRFDQAALLRACAEQGWSLAQLGRVTGLSQPTVSAAAHGVPITPRTAFRIRQAFLGATGASFPDDDWPIGPIERRG